MAIKTVALVGAAGGVGTTRLTVECGATLARAGWDIALFDAAFATQGLAAYVDGPVDRGVTDLATGDAALETTLHHVSLDLPGRVAVCPAHAPFERLARAKTAGAAERFEEQLAAASLSYDAVLLDTPPVGANQALAAVDAADQVGLVTTDTDRGADAAAMMRERLADVGHRPDAVVANRSDGNGPLAPDVAVPTSDLRRARDAPASLRGDRPFSPAVAEVTETLFDVSLDLEFTEEGRLGSFVGSG